MNTRVFTGSIYSAHTKCDCGGSFERVPHHKYTRNGEGILFPVCADCFENATRLMVQIKMGKKVHDFVYDRLGSTLKTIEDCIALSAKVKSEQANEMFDYDNYKGKHAANTPGETVERFINRVILKQYPQKDEHPDYRYYKEFMAGYFSDTGIFALSDIHLEFYIKEMHVIKEPERQYVRGLFKKLMDMRPDFARVSA